MGLRETWTKGYYVIIFINIYSLPCYYGQKTVIHDSLLFVAMKFTDHNWEQQVPKRVFLH